MIICAATYCVDYVKVENDSSTLSQFTTFKTSLITSINSITSLPGSLYGAGPYPYSPPSPSGILSAANTALAKVDASRKKLVSNYAAAKAAYDREFAMQTNDNVVICPKNYKVFACSGALIVSGVTYFPAPQRVVGTTTGDTFEQCKAEVVFSASSTVSSNNLTAICSHVEP